MKSWSLDTTLRRLIDSCWPRITQMLKFLRVAFMRQLIDEEEKLKTAAKVSTFLHYFFISTTILDWLNLTQWGKRFNGFWRTDEREFDFIHRLSHDVFLFFQGIEGKLLILTNFVYFTFPPTWPTIENWRISVDTFFLFSNLTSISTFYLYIFCITPITDKRGKMYV